MTGNGTGRLEVHWKKLALLQSIVMIKAWDLELLLYPLCTISMFPFTSYGDFEGWKESKSKYRFPVTPPMYSLCALGWKWFGLQFGVVIYIL